MSVDTTVQQRGHTFQRLVVCAAIRNKHDGTVLCGPRHGHCLNTAMRLACGCRGENWECGFVDQKNVFMTRHEAWVVACAAGQIRRPTGLEENYESTCKLEVGDVDNGLLFSENLY